MIYNGWSSNIYNLQLPIYNCLHAFYPLPPPSFFGWASFTLYQSRWGVEENGRMGENERGWERVEVGSRK
jgi:hypothetical protein